MREMIEVWSRYADTMQWGSYRVVAADDDISAVEVATAKLRANMWPHNGSYPGRAEMTDMLTRGLVETCHCNHIDRLAYPEAL